MNKSVARVHPPFRLSTHCPPTSSTGLKHQRTSLFPIRHTQNKFATGSVMNFIHSEFISSLRYVPSSYPSQPRLTLTYERMNPRLRSRRTSCFSPSSSARSPLFSWLALTTLQLGLAPSLPFPGRHPQHNPESQVAKSKYHVLHMSTSTRSEFHPDIRPVVILPPRTAVAGPASALSLQPARSERCLTRTAPTQLLKASSAF